MIGTTRDVMSTVLQAIERLGITLPVELEQVEISTEVTHLASVILQTGNKTAVGVARGVSVQESTALAALYALNRLLIDN